MVNVFSHESYHWLINNEHITRLIGLETPYNWLVFVVVRGLARRVVLIFMDVH